MTLICPMIYDLNYSIRFLIELLYVDSINKSIYLCLDLYFLLSFTIILLLLFICYFEQCCSTCILYNLLSAPSWHISPVSEILIIHLTAWLIDMTLIVVEIRSCYIYELNRMVDMATFYLKCNYIYYYFYVCHQCYKTANNYSVCIDGNLSSTCRQTYKCFDVYVTPELLIIDDEVLSSLDFFRTISFLFPKFRFQLVLLHLEHCS